jgi:hypothetical protein
VTRALARASSGRRSRPHRAPLAAAVSVALPLMACGPVGDDVPEVPRGSEVEEEAAPAALGPTVAVVIPADGAFGATVLADVRAALGSTLDERRSRPSSPDEPPLGAARVVVARDAAELTDQVAVLAELGTDLVCVVGGAASEAIRDAARLHASTTYCLLPPTPTIDGEAAAASLDGVVPIEALGRALGRIARTAAVEGAPDSASNGPPRVVAVVTGTDAAIGAPLRRGVLDAEGEGTVVFLAPDPDRPAVEVVAELAAASVDVVVVDGSPGSEALVEAALGAGLLVVAPEVVVDALPAGLAGGVVATWRTRWDLAVLAVVERFLVAPGPGELVLGLDTVVEVEAGPAAGPEVRALLTAVLAGG